MLNRVYNNVVGIRLVSTEIPYPINQITDFNNNIYWENLQDGDYKHKITIPPGNYSIKNLEMILNQAFNEESKKHGDNYRIIARLDKSTNKLTLKSYNKVLLEDPFVDINKYTNVIVHHPDHSITISDVNTEIIVESTTNKNLNGSYNVVKIIDPDHYIINMIIDQIESYKNIFVFTPSKFRLLYDQSDSLHKLLGFNNNNNSEYTVFKTENVSDNVKLTTDNYILMKINGFDFMESNGKVKRAFAKIIMDKTNKILYNTFVDSEGYYYLNKPLNELSELHVSFVNSDNELINFNNLDHSFTIELLILS